VQQDLVDQVGWWSRILLLIQVLLEQQILVEEVEVVVLEQLADGSWRFRNSIIRYKFQN
jgi:hypothetical protein